MSESLGHSSSGFMHELLPWAFITKFGEGVVVQKDGILQRTFAYRAPDVDSSGGDEINMLALRVNDFAKRLGSGWALFIEAQRFYAREYPAEAVYGRGGFTCLAPYLIDREREEAFTQAGRHFESSYYITFSWMPPSENIKKLTAMFVAAAAGEEGTIKQNVIEFINVTNDVISLLVNNMDIAPLDNEETISYLHSSISLNRHWIQCDWTQIMLDRILPDMALQNSNTMMLGDYYIPIIGVNDFPSSTYPAMLDFLNRARIEYRWVTRYICLSKEDAKKEAAKKEKQHRGARKTFLQTFAESTSKDGGGGGGVINHGAGVKEADSVSAGVEIETDEASLGYYTSCVMVWDADLKRAKKKADIIKSIINGAGFTCKEEVFNALAAWRSMMPGDVFSNYRALPVMSYNMSHTVPLSSVWAGMRENAHAKKISGVSLPHLVCGTREGTPFYLNINPTDVGHTAVWGPTGAGKSTLLNLLETQFFKYPRSQVVVFDKGRSCRQICLACGGLFYEPAAETISGVAFQPLRELEGERNLMDAQDFIEACVTINEYKVTPPMRQAVKECLELMSEMSPDTRTITTFLQYINYQDPETGKPVMKEMLGDYLFGAGKYGRVFDMRTNTLSLNSRFVAFEMEELMNRGKGCVVPSLVYLFNTVEKMFDGSKLSMLVLDEAWLFLKNESFAGKIAEWLKVLRKKNVFVIFATQDVADVEKSPLKTTIIQQCLTKIYLADPSAATAGMKDVYSAFGLTEFEIGLIASSVMKRDYFYTSPLGRRAFQLDLGELTLALIGSPDHQLLDILVKELPFGTPLCRRILQARGVDYAPYLNHDAPRDDSGAKPAAVPASAPPDSAPPEQWILKSELEGSNEVTAPPLETRQETVPAAAPAPRVSLREIIESAKTIIQNKPDVSARALAAELGVNHTYAGALKRIIKLGDDALLKIQEAGCDSVKEAMKLLDGLKKNTEPEKDAA